MGREEVDQRTLSTSAGEQTVVVTVPCTQRNVSIQYLIFYFDRKEFECEKYQF
jgi:uncharacterized protein YcfL